MESIADLMVDQQLVGNEKHIYHHYQPAIINGQKCYNELNSGMWWEETELVLRARCGPDSYLLPIIVYLDSTQLDATGKLSCKPICITLGNFSIKLRVCL